MVIMILTSLVLSLSSSLLLPTLLMSSDINFLGSQCILFTPVSDYSTFQKHNNSEVLKPPSQLHFSLPSIILADLLAKRSLRKLVQKVMVCDL